MSARCCEPCSGAWQSRPSPTGSSVRRSRSRNRLVPAGFRLNLAPSAMFQPGTSAHGSRAGIAPGMPPAVQGDRTVASRSEPAASGNRGLVGRRTSHGGYHPLSVGSSSGASQYRPRHQTCWHDPNAARAGGWRARHGDSHGDRRSNRRANIVSWVEIHRHFYLSIAIDLKALRHYIHV